MSRTVTLRMKDSVYERLRTLAEGDNRSLSNFIETATLRCLEVVWTRFVRAGRWHEALAEDDDRAKEILVLCRTHP